MISKNTNYYENRWQRRSKMKKKVKRMGGNTIVDGNKGVSSIVGWYFVENRIEIVIWMHENVREYVEIHFICWGILVQSQYDGCMNIKLGAAIISIEPSNFG